jgi:hypothetical protein
MIIDPKWQGCVVIGEEREEGWRVGVDREPISNSSIGEKRVDIIVCEMLGLFDGEEELV